MNGFYFQSLRLSSFKFWICCQLLHLQLTAGSKTINYKFNKLGKNNSGTYQMKFTQNSFSLYQYVVTSSWDHRASYLTSTWCSFPGRKAAEAWGWSFTSISAKATNEWSCTSTPPQAFIAFTKTNLPLLLKRGHVADTSILFPQIKSHPKK
jgi:hypothetical protein